MKAHRTFDFFDQGPEYTEHLTLGRFEVKQITHEDFSWGTRDRVLLQQKETLSVENLIGTRMPAALGPARLLRWLEHALDPRMVPDDGKNPAQRGNVSAYPSREVRYNPVHWVDSKNGRWMGEEFFRMGRSAAEATANVTKWRLLARS